MFVRANSVKITRVSRKCSTISFITLFGTLVLFCCLMIIVSENSTLENSAKENPELHARLGK